MIELIGLSLKTNNPLIYSKIIESDLIEIFLGLFVKYEWNNLLHNQVEKIINQILEGNSDEMKEYLLNKVKLVDFIVENTKDLMFNTARGTMRKGYLGQLFRIANKLLDSKDPIITNYLKDSSNWTEFTETTLKTTNELYRTHLGGRDPRAKHEEEDDSRDIQLDIPKIIFQKFSKFFQNPDRGVKDQPTEKEGDDEAEIEEDEDDEDDDRRDEEKKHESDLLKDLESDDNNKHTLRFGNRENQEENKDEHGDNMEEFDNPAPRGRISFGRKMKHEVEPEEREEPEEPEETNKEEIQWFSEPDPDADERKFLDSNFWKADTWHNVDDILKEMN